MRIGLDLDDVQYPWYDEAHAWFIEQGYVPPDPLTGQHMKPTTWHPYREYGSLDFEEWVFELEMAGQTIYLADPMPGVVEGWRMLREAGHELWIITARGTGLGTAQQQLNVRRWTLDWLARHNPEMARNVIFSYDKTALRCDAFLDDRVAAVEAQHAHGARAYLHTQPWNADVDTFVPRVGCFTEFVEEILDLNPKEDA